MVRHEELDERPPRLLDGRDLGLHDHPGVAFADARRGVHARADVDDADAAHADRGLILLMTERRDRDAAQPRRVEDRRPSRHGNCASVDRERHGAHARNSGRLPVAGSSVRDRTPTHTPAGHTWSRTWASTSSAKYFITEAIGTGTT